MPLPYPVIISPIASVYDLWYLGMVIVGTYVKVAYMGRISWRGNCKGVVGTNDFFEKGTP